MKKLCVALLLCVSACATSFSMTLREGFDEIKQLPDLKGVVSDSWIDVLGGWFDSIPVDGAEIVGKAHEVGAGQTVYYGSRVEAIAKSLPQEYKILSGADYSNLIYFFAERIDDNNSRLLILIDQAYQGKTVAMIGKVDNQIIKALKNGDVRFTPDHKIVVNVPILVCD